MTYQEALRELKKDIDGDLPIGEQTVINRTLRVGPLLKVIEAAERYLDLLD